MNISPEIREPPELTPKSLRKRKVKNPPRKKCRMMMTLKAQSKGRRKNRPFKGYKMACCGLAKKGWPEN
jgi:hypothetical protein